MNRPCYTLYTVWTLASIQRWLQVQDLNAHNICAHVGIYIEVLDRGIAAVNHHVLPPISAIYLVALRPVSWVLMHASMGEGLRTDYTNSMVSPSAKAAKKLNSRKVPFMCVQGPKASLWLNTPYWLDLRGHSAKESHNTDSGIGPGW